MASPPSVKRQKLSASTASPATLPAQTAPVEAPAPVDTAANDVSAPASTLNPRKRRASPTTGPSPIASPPVSSAPGEPSNSTTTTAAPQAPTNAAPASTTAPAIVEEGAKKKGRTNTPWTAAEEQRLKTMRDAGNSWGEIAKAFPSRTEGSVKKHWYKDMHYAEFAEDETIALREAIREYDANKWKVIGQKVGKPAKACEQYAKEHFRSL